MTSYFDAAFALYASPQIEQFFGEPMTLSRGANSEPVTAVQSSHANPTLDVNGNYTTITSIDFDIQASAYAAIGVEPEPNDRITDAAGNIYEVMPLNGEKCFAPADSAGKIFRVHTKRIKQAS